MNMRPLTAPSITSSGESPTGIGMKVGRRLGAGWLLFGVAFQAGAADEEPTTYWDRIQEKGSLERC